METRIKYIKKNNGWYYAVQVKKWIFWKTIYIDAMFSNVEKFIDTLDKIDDFNGKTKSLSKIICNGWGVRNVYKNSGIGYSIKFFESYPIRRSKSDDSEMIWTDINGRTVPAMEINAEELFGKECLEPMKLRITIEQIEE